MARLKISKKNRAIMHSEIRRLYGDISSDREIEAGIAIREGFHELYTAEILGAISVGMIYGGQGFREEGDETEKPIHSNIVVNFANEVISLFLSHDPEQAFVTLGSAMMEARTVLENIATREGSGEYPLLVLADECKKMVLRLKKAAEAYQVGVPAEPENEIKARPDDNPAKQRVAFYTDKMMTD